MKVELRHVNTVTRRRKDGSKRVYYYHRPTGLRLPDDPSAPEFHARLRELNESMQAASPSGPPSGTIAALAAAYKAAPEFPRNRHTRKSYVRYIDRVCELIGDMPVKHLRAAHVWRLRDRYADKPRTANYMMQVLSTMLTWGVKRGWREDNPARTVDPLKAKGERRPWTDREVQIAFERFPRELILPVALALYTGQRQADVLRMAWSAYDGEGITVRQSKTGEQLWIPAHPDLKALLQAAPRDHLVICTTDTGRPWSGGWLQRKFRQAAKDAGLPSDLTFHGLRHTAATRLAEAGASPMEIAAVTGHRSLAMVERYTRGAQQRRLATAAVERLDCKRSPSVPANGKRGGSGDAQ
jgi:integrase